MKYTLFLHSNEAAFADITEAQIAESQAAYGVYIEALTKAGVFVATDWLQPSMTSTTISMTTGERQVEDGPFADSKDQIGGYFIIEVDNLDEALAWAEQCPAAYYGTVEVRPSAMPVAA